MDGAFKDAQNIFDSGEFGETFFGRARILEEKGLVVRYSPFEKDILSDLTFSLELLEHAAGMYADALRNAENEIVGSADINSRLLRTTGIIAAVCPEIAENIEGPEIKKYLDKGLQYALKELDSRLKAGETEGFNLANAYHTRAVVLTGMVGAKEYYPNTDALYELAKKDISKAKALLPDSMVSSLLDFKQAWLEFRHNPKNTPKIEKYLNEALFAQKDESKKWDKGVKDKFKDKVFTLATHLGGNYMGRVKEMYRQ